MVEQIHAAIGRPDFDGGFAYSQGFFELPAETTVMLAAGRWLHAQGWLGLIDREREATCRALVSLLQLARHQRRERLLIAQLTRFSLVTRATGLTLHALGPPG